MSLFKLIFTSFGLSMDSFSLSTIYGTLNTSKKIRTKMAISVGSFHIIMTLIGYILGRFVTSIVNINANILVGIIFLILSLETLISIFKKEELKKIDSLLSIILFSLAVSFDGLSIGIGLGILKSSVIVESLVFGLFSFASTILGLMLGNKLKSYFGKIASLAGSIVLLLLGISYLM